VKDFAQRLERADQKLVQRRKGWTSSKSSTRSLASWWKTKPSWYIRAAQTGMIPPPAEEMMAKRMKGKLRRWTRVMS